MADKAIVEMGGRHFDSIIRQIKTMAADRVGIFRSATRTAMKRMRLRPDPSKAVAGVPEGSDQHDAQSFIIWTQKITKRDKAAVRQLIAIHATASASLEG